MAYSTEIEPTRYADDGDWFSTNAPPAARQSATFIPPSGPGGRYTYDDLQKINQTLFGGTLTDVTPWVGQKDAFQNLLNEPQAQSFLNSSAKAAPSNGKIDWTDPSMWTRENINGYAKSRGVDDPNFADYWLGKKDELFQRGKDRGDPNYAFTRLSMADEFGGERYGGESGAAQSFDYPSWNDTFSYADFQAPTDVTEQNDPGFQEAMQGGIDALQRSAAARGTALDTGTLRDLQAFGQQFKANEFEKVYNRAANTYLMNRNNAADLYNQRYQQYLQGFNNALTKFGTNFGVDQSLWNRALTESNTGFARQMSLADLGLAAIGNTANAGAGYANNAGNLVTGIGNAQAAGSIANGNLWGNAVGRLSDIGSSFLWNRRPTGSTLYD